MGVFGDVCDGHQRLCRCAVITLAATAGITLLPRNNFRPIALREFACCDTKHVAAQAIAGAARASSSTRALASVKASTERKVCQMSA
jgi:hypothetical protein